jgi:hypothetical protein
MKIELTYLQMTLIGMKLAIWGLVASIAAGAAWSLFSLVAVIVFIWLILRKTAEIKPVEVEAVDETPVDDKLKDSENP